MNIVFLFNGFYFLSLCFCLTRFASPFAKKKKISYSSMLPVEIIFLLSGFRNFILILNK